MARDTIVRTTVFGGPRAELVTVTNGPQNLHDTTVIPPNAALRGSSGGTEGPPGNVRTPGAGPTVPAPTAEGKHQTNG